MQTHEREDARDTGEEHGGFKGAGGDEAERHALVLSLEHRIERDGGADAGEGDDDLEKAAPERAGVGAGADDEVLGRYRAVEREWRGECGYRDKGNQVEDARDERGLPC